MPVLLLAPLLAIGIPLTLTLPYVLYRSIRSLRHSSKNPPTTTTSPTTNTSNPPHLRRTPSGAPHASASSASLTSTSSTSTYPYAMITPPLSPHDEGTIIWTSSARNFARHPHRRMKSNGADSGFCDAGGGEGTPGRDSAVGSFSERSSFGGEPSSFGSRFGGLDETALRGKRERTRTRMSRERSATVGYGEDDDGEEFVRFGKAATWLRDKVGIN